MQNKRSSKVLVVGATGGSGRAAVESLLEAGHTVTAFARDTSTFAPHPRLAAISGDVLNAEDLDRAVRGHDAVIVTLGIRDNALRVRLFGRANTALDVRSRGTKHVIAAMKTHGVRKLIVQTSFGVGETKTKLPFVYRLLFALLLKPQIADTELQERAVRESGLDWILAQPVSLTDELERGAAFASSSGETRKMKISRRSVGAFLAEATARQDYLSRTIALSGV